MARGRKGVLYSGKYRHPFDDEWIDFNNRTLQEISKKINRSRATIIEMRKNHLDNYKLVFAGRGKTDKKEAVEPVIIEFFK